MHAYCLPVLCLHPASTLSVPIQYSVGTLSVPCQHSVSKYTAIASTCQYSVSTLAVPCQNCISTLSVFCQYPAITLPVPCQCSISNVPELQQQPASSQVWMYALCHYPANTLTGDTHSETGCPARLAAQVAGWLGHINGNVRENKLYWADQSSQGRI